MLNHLWFSCALFFLAKIFESRGQVGVPGVFCYENSFGLFYGGFECAYIICFIVFENIVKPIKRKIEENMWLVLISVETKSKEKSWEKFPSSSSDTGQYVSCKDIILLWQSSN